MTRGGLLPWSESIDKSNQAKHFFVIPEPDTVRMEMHRAACGIDCSSNGSIAFAQSI